MRKFRFHDEEGPPCPHMEPLLQRTADESAHRLTRLYVLWHTSSCGRCNRFLGRLRETIRRLKHTKEDDPSPEVISRLASGTWRDES